MAASHTCFKLLLLYLHLIAFFEKAGSLKYGPKICARSEACFDTFWGSTRKDGLDYEGFCWFYSQDRGSRRHVGFGAGRAFCITPERKSNTWLFLSLLYYSWVEIFAQILALVISWIRVGFVRSQSKATNVVSAVTCVMDGVTAKSTKTI